MPARTARGRRRAPAGVPAAIAATMLLSCGPRDSAPSARLDLAEALGVGDTAGFSRVSGPRPFRFPEDHGAHPGYRTEWWYFTGNVDAGDGRRFGYQVTFFRSAVSPEPPPIASAWATNQVYMAHFAVSDIDGSGFHSFERFARGAAGLAGAVASPFRVWVDDWSGSSVGPGTFPLRLHAADGDVAIDFEIEAGKPAVLQGDRGYSRKTDDPGNATYYYSFTRMPTTGTVSVAGRRFAVSGSSWLDREWGTSVLGQENAGWDWFAIQLDDGTDLMAARLRRRDGRPDPFTFGSIVESDGRSRTLRAADLVIRELAEWESEAGVRYPSRWRIEVADAGLALDVEPLLADQELDVSIRYWEGAVEAVGMRNDAPVRGRGYVELTGYDARQPSAGAR